MITFLKSCAISKVLLAVFYQIWAKSYMPVLSWCIAKTHVLFSYKWRVFIQKWYQIHDGVASSKPTPLKIQWISLIMALTSLWVISWSFMTCYTPGALYWLLLMEMKDVMMMMIKCWTPVCMSYCVIVICSSSADNGGSLEDGDEDITEDMELEQLHDSAYDSFSSQGAYKMPNSVCVLWRVAYFDLLRGMLVVLGFRTILEVYVWYCDILLSWRYCGWWNTFFNVEVPTIFGSLCMVFIVVKHFYWWMMKY